MAIPERYLVEPFRIAAGASARDAAHAMAQHGIGALLVVGDDGRAVGIVTDRDLALHVLRNELDPAAAPVGACASSPLVTLERSASLLDAAQRMRAHGVRRLPIVDEQDEVVGWISADDLVAELDQSLHGIAEAERAGFEREERERATSGSPRFGKE